MADVPTPPSAQQQQVQVQAQNKEQLAEAGKERLRFQLIRQVSDQERLNKDIQQRADKAASTFAGRMRQIIKRYQGETTRLATRVARQNMAIADLDIEAGLAGIGNQQALYARRAQEIQTLQERYNEHFTKFAGVLNDKTLAFLQQQSNISAPTLTSIMAGYEMARASAAEREERRLQNDMATIDKLGKLDEQYTNTLLELQKLRNEHKRQQYENNKAILEAEAKALDFTTKAEIDTENTLLKFNESDRMYRQSRAQQDSQGAEDVLSQLAAMAGGKNPAGLKPAVNKNSTSDSNATDQGEFDLVGNNEVMTSLITNVAQQQGVSFDVAKEVFNDYLNIVKYAESRGDGQAVSSDPGSTANGFYQITNETFGDLKNRIMPRYIDMNSDFAQRVLGAKRAMDLSEEDQATLAVLLAVGRSPARFTKEFRTTVVAGSNGDIDGYGEGLKTIYLKEHFASQPDQKTIDNYDKAWNHHGQQKALWLQQQEQAQAQAGEQAGEQQASSAGGTQPSTETVTPQPAEPATVQAESKKDRNIGVGTGIGIGVGGLAAWKYFRGRAAKSAAEAAEAVASNAAKGGVGRALGVAGRLGGGAATVVTVAKPLLDATKEGVNDLMSSALGQSNDDLMRGERAMLNAPGASYTYWMGPNKPPKFPSFYKDLSFAERRDLVNATTLEDARVQLGNLRKAGRISDAGANEWLNFAGFNNSESAQPVTPTPEQQDDAMVEPPQFASLGDADKKALLSAANDEEVFSILDNLQQSGLDIANEEKIYWATYLNKLRGAK